MSGVDVDRLGAVDIWDPRLDYYTRTHVTPFLDVGPGVSLSGVEPKPIASLLDLLDQTDGGESFTLLVRATPHPSMDREDARATDRLALMGLTVTPIDLAPSFRVDNRKTRVIAVRVTKP